MSGLNEMLRFHLLVASLSLVAFLLGCRLAFLHTDTPEQPNYGFTRDMQGLRGSIYPSNRNSAPFALLTSRLFFSSISAVVFVT